MVSYSTPLSELFLKTKAENRAALIGYLPAGFPTIADSSKVIAAMVEGGVDAIEIGFPYSDPVMDGPIIQNAAEQSLKQGTGASDVFDLMAATTKLGVPAVVMTYWNPIEKYGVDDFAKSLKAAGGSGVITPDLTVEESGRWASASENSEINRIYVVAPSTSDQRMPLVTSQCSGFIYAASLMGVTGTRTSVSGDARSLVARIRETSTLPIAVGLGVSNAAQAHEVADYADGVIVGSAFIREVQESGSIDEACTRVRELARSLSAGVRR
ncbi:MAG: tryptophan synthase subunit alpha [Actinomycetes bacterium]